MLKNNFEQIFSPPFIVESIWAELGDTPEHDVLVRVHYDGHHSYDTTGVLIAANDDKREKEAADWLRRELKPEHSLAQAAWICLVAWQALVDEKSIAEIKVPEQPPHSIPGKKLETSLLDRKMGGAVRYRELDLK